MAGALFVLAGMGLASILSPLVSSALATVGQVVNIADHSSSAYFAKVDSNGALKTAGTVTGGNVSISAPSPSTMLCAHKPSATRRWRWFGAVLLMTWRTCRIRGCCKPIY